MKKYLYLQVAVLICGTIFAWFTVFGDFGRFFANNGNIFELSGCKFPNPLSTPCFYGSIAFLIALTLAFQILLSPTKKLQKILNILLFGGTIFAWSMVVKEFYKYRQTPVGEYIGCTGLEATSPIATPCFTGAIFFLLALIIATTISFFYYKKTRLNAP